MIDKDKNNDQSRLNNNLDRLLQSAEPTPTMPESLKSRIRARLAEMECEPGRKNIPARRWIVWPVAAAAVLALFFIVFWIGGSPETIVWADVQEQLNQVHSMTLKAYADISAGTGQPTRTFYRVYYQDPGLMRSEEYASDTSPGSTEEKPVKIIIIRREPGSREALTLYPQLSRAELSAGTFLASGPEPPSQAPMDLASANWNLMKEITEDNTRRIGDRVINGIPAVGFEWGFPDRLFINPGRQAYGRLWARSDDGVPLLVEVEYRPPQGPITHMEFSDIRWNVPLEESLFDPVVPEGWRVSRNRTESAEYKDTGFAPGITLQIGPDGREPLAATGDVPGVIRGEQITHLDSGIPRQLSITIELKPEAMQRLRDYANTYPAEIMVVDFNGQLSVPVNLNAAGPTQLTFDLSLLDLSLAELEARYLTTTIERNGL